jgi:hypothetical protein
LAPGIQHDVHEVLSLASDWLNPDVMGDSNLNFNPCSTVQQFIKDHFGGIISRSFIVDGGELRKTSEPFFHFALEVRDTIESCIASHFAAEEIVYNVGTTEHPDLQKAIVRSSVAAFPSVLHVHLKRFRHDGQKIYVNCTFSDILKFSELGEPFSKASPTYRLQSVLVHIGTRISGHYIVFT